MKKRNDNIKEIIGKLAIKTKRIIIPTITMLLLASQLFGCASASKQEAYDMLQNSEAVELEIAAPESDTDTGTELELLSWLQLSSLETHPELRTAFEELLGITVNDDGTKAGMLYTDEKNDRNQNNTLYNVISKTDFMYNYIRNEDQQSKIDEIANSEYTDLEENQGLVAVLNAYFELLPDQEQGQFDGDSSISRAQAMTLVMRATTPVNEAQKPDTDEAFTSAVGESIYTDFAAPMNEFTYLNTSNGLTESTFNTTMSCGEYIYMLANYFNTEYQAYLDSMGYKNNIYDEDITISTVSDAGDITFTEAIEDAINGVPSDMYKTFQIAINMNLITESDLEDWDSAITKADAIELFNSMTCNYYRNAGNQSLQDQFAQNREWPDVNPEDVDPKTTQMDSETATALGLAEGAEIDAKYGGDVAWAEYAKSQGADNTLGWCWIYYTGQGAGDQESYAVYMKEDSPRYGEVFHLGDYLPCGLLFVGANNEEQGKADDAVFKRAYDNGEFGDGVILTEDGDIIIN